MLKPRFFIHLIGTVLITKCVTTSSKAGYSSQTLTFATGSLFNQRTVSKIAKKSWLGDWVFRRDRLDLMDRALQNIKPDVFFMQEALEKDGSFAESDFNVLAANSLKGFTVSKFETQVAPETEEREMLAVAIANPLQFLAPPPEQKSLWQLGADGFLSVVEISDGSEPIVLFNVQLPTNAEQLDMWLAFLRERVRERLKVIGVCKKRLVLGGRIVPDQAARKFNEFLAEFELKDSSSGFCQIASRCYTAFSQNEIFMGIMGDQTPTQADRILLHRDSIVYESQRVFDIGTETKKYPEYGLTKLWASQRFGWRANVRLATCDK